MAFITKSHILFRVTHLPLTCLSERLLSSPTITNPRKWKTMTPVTLSLRPAVHMSAVTFECTEGELLTHNVPSQVFYLDLGWNTLGCARLLKFWQFSSELTKTWSSGTTECRVWIGNCNVKVWKSTEHKLHKIWRSLIFCTNWGKWVHPWILQPNSMEARNDMVN